MSTTIAVIGAGAIGGTVLAWLTQREDLEVSACVRTPVAEVHVTTPAGPISARPRVFLRPDQVARSMDWVLIATKTYDAPGAAAWLPPLIGPKTRVAVLQNGIEHVQRFDAYVEMERIVPAIVDIPAERNAPGNIWQRRNGSIIVPEGSEGLAFVDLFSKTPIAVSTTANFTKAAWEKLCLNCVGAVSVLTLQPAGVARQTAIAAIMRALTAECVAVGVAEGAELSDDLPDIIVQRYQDGPPDAINSMHADRIAGRPMEIDARNGVIVRLGAKHDIATPMNALVVALLEAAALKSVVT